jgi:phage terminase Nu1 subunit (DNA packaging protein)
LVTRRELARRLPCDPRTVARWQEEGLPVAKRGRGGRPSLYDEAAVRAWLTTREETARQQAPDFTASRARKELAQAIEAEQRVAIRASKLIPIEDVDRLWSGQVAAIRARLLAWPTALADRIHRVAALEGAAGVEQLLQEIVYDALRELAAGAAPTRRRRTRKASTTRKRSRGGKPRKRT